MYLHQLSLVCTMSPRSCDVANIPYKALSLPIPSHFLLELEYPTSAPGEKECWYQSQELCHLNKKYSVKMIKIKTKFSFEFNYKPLV